MNAHDRQIRKQTLEEVLKDFDETYGTINQEKEGCAFVFRRKLEQKIKAME